MCIQSCRYSGSTFSSLCVGVDELEGRVVTGRHLFENLRVQLDDDLLMTWLVDEVRGLIRIFLEIVQLISTGIAKETCQGSGPGR